MSTKYSFQDIIEGIGGAALMGVHMMLFPFLRGYRARWGVTGEEARASLPGDELVPNPKISMTWGITINAPVEAVWPWVVQIGQGRGGFYSYQFLENITGAEIYNADRILSEHQELPLETGISLALGMPPLPIAQHEDGRFYFLHGIMDTKTMDGFGSMPDTHAYPEKYMNVGWGFYVHKAGENQTRFLSRWLADYDPALTNKIAYNLFLEPIGFVMGRKMLLGAKQRAEQ